MSVYPTNVVINQNKPDKVIRKKYFVSNRNRLKFVNNIN